MRGGTAATGQEPGLVAQDAVEQRILRKQRGDNRAERAGYQEPVEEPNPALQAGAAGRIGNRPDQKCAAARDARVLPARSAAIGAAGHRQFLQGRYEHAARIPRIS